MTEQSGPYIQMPTTPGLIDLGLGQPSPALLPMDAIAAGASTALARADRLLLQYGALRGYGGFLESLAAFLTRGYGHPVAAEELLVTAGISQALAMVADVFGAAAPRVATGDPTYFLARGIFDSARLDVLGVPVDARGLDVDALERRLAAGPEIGFVYCIPAFHNPSTVTLEGARARALLDLAERHDFVVVADEPYVLLDFGTRPPCLMSYDEGRGRVLSLGSFSKILGPGLRLGWAHGHPSVIERLAGHGTLRSGGCINPIVAAIVHPLIDDGFLDGHVERLRRSLASRRAALCEGLTRNLPQISFDSPAGGYFVWLTLPEGADATQIDAAAREHHGVGWTPGPRCAVDRDLGAHARVSISFYDEGELEEATRRLSAAMPRT